MFFFFGSNILFLFFKLDMREGKDQRTQDPKYLKVRRIALSNQTSLATNLLPPVRNIRNFLDLNFEIKYTLHL